MSTVARALWETHELRLAAGDTLRPGGFALTDRAAELAGIRPGWRVLDVGCGLGATVGRLRGRFGAQAWGVEPSPTQINCAPDPSALVRGQGDELPFRAAAFDAVFCECVLSLFDDQSRGLKEFHRVLKPGGYLALTDLCSDSAPVEGGSCADRARSLPDIRRMAEKSGFSVLVTEDHSHHLKELAARLVFAGSGVGTGCGCGRKGLGYYLMIAQRQGATDAG